MGDDADDAGDAHDEADSLDERFERFSRWFPGGAAPARRPTLRPARDDAQRARIRRWAQSILDADSRWMILDTETTGFGPTADIIEVAAVSPHGEPLFESLIQPMWPIPRDITAITGINDRMVATSPRFRQVWEQLLAAHCGARGVIAYNAPFDIRMLQQNALRHCGAVWAPIGSDCLMRAYARYRGERQAGRGYRSHKLGVACAQMGIAHDHAHRALDDCRVSARLLQAMAAGQ